MRATASKFGAEPERRDPDAGRQRGARRAAAALTRAAAAQREQCPLRYAVLEDEEERDGEAEAEASVSSEAEAEAEPSWARVALGVDAPTGRMGHAAATDPDGRLWTFGGFCDGAFSNALHVFEAAADGGKPGGSLAKHIPPDDPKVAQVVTRLMDALGTPSESVQRTIATSCAAA